MKEVNTKGKAKALARISNDASWIMLEGPLFNRTTKEKDIEEINTLANIVKEVCNLRYKKEQLQLTNGN
jgi:hypothetical protein